MDSQSQKEAMTEKGAKRKEDSLCAGGVCCVGKSPHSKQKIKCIVSSSLLPRTHFKHSEFRLLCVNSVQRTLCFTKGGPVTVWAELYFGNVFETRSSRNKAQPSRPHPATCICVPLATDVFN